MPNKTYTGSIGPVLEVKGRKAPLKHPLNAHTDGDTYVYFADANVLSTGDTVAIGRYPNIDFVNGGSIKGMIAASDAYLALANDTTKIVPGHGPLATKAQLAEYRAMLVAARDRMAKLIADGKERGRHLRRQAVCRSRRQMGGQRAGQQELDARGVFLAEAVSLIATAA